MNKENYYREPNQAKASRSKGAFSKLLSDVTIELRHECDEKVAVKLVTEEVLDVTHQWLNEENDKRIAQKLTKELEINDKKMKQKEIEDNEKEALNLAIHERKRLQQEQQMKQEIEAKDKDFAKRTIQEEKETYEKLGELCANDINYAKELYNQLQDEILAEELYKQEQAEYSKKQAELDCLREADEKLAQKEQELFDKEYKNLKVSQIENDFEFARNEQTALKVNEAQSKTKQEVDDAKLSLNLTIKSIREDHRRHKRLQSLQIFNKLTTVQAIKEQWETAEADIEDVANGICITILLPNLLDLKIRRTGPQKIEFDAKRMRSINEDNTNENNSTYCAEFIIEGHKVNISQKDLSYEYSSEVGIVFIYIDNVRLQNEDEDFKAESKNSLINKISNKFSRLFFK
jgi:hypothetical protein